MKIGFATADWAIRALAPDGRPSYGGSGWARIGLPASRLRAMGLDVVEGTLVWSAEAGVFLVRQWPFPGQAEDDPALFALPDLIVLQRWMFASVGVEAVTAKRNGQVIVNDVDDHFWALDPRNQAARATDPARNPIENRVHYQTVLRNSSAVTVSTPFLADVLRREVGVQVPIHVIPNCVDLAAFEDVRTRNLRRAREHVATPIPTLVGWVGATPWRSGDLETMRGILGPFIESNDLLAYHGGHLDRAETFAAQAEVKPSRMILRGMVPIGEYPSLFEGLDLGLVPLRDVPFNRAKSWIKGLEYAAAGVPFVAQDLPEYVRLVARGVGRVANRTKDWRRQMGHLLDPAARLEEAESNAAGVKAHDIAQGIGLWRDLYLDLLANA